MEKFLGGNPLAVLLKLVIVSIVVGIALSAIGFSPAQLLAFIPNLVEAIYEAIYNLGIRWADSVWTWFVLGALIVIPVWGIVRLLKFIGGDTKKDAKRH